MFISDVNTGGSSHRSRPKRRPKPHAQPRKPLGGSTGTTHISNTGSYTPPSTPSYSTPSYSSYTPSPPPRSTSHTVRRSTHRSPPRPTYKKASHKHKGGDRVHADYVIKSGDTLKSIANRFHENPHKLAKLNGIKPSAQIYVGGKLRLPGHTSNLRPKHPKHHKKKPKPPPSIRKYLAGNTTYSNQMSDYRKALQDFLAGNKKSRVNTREDFQTAVDRMQGQRKNALNKIEADFASRGLLNSGLYGKSRSKYNKKYQQNLSDLTQSKQRNIQALKDARQQQRSLVGNKRQSARQQAIQRRAQKYNIS